jgi:hypothetical protein
VGVVGGFKAVSAIVRFKHPALDTMPFHFNAGSGVTVNGGTFTDVGRDMNVSHYNQSDSHDVKVNSDNVSSRTYGNITGTPIPSSICPFQERIL